MAEIWGAALVVVGGAYGAHQQSKAGERGANAQERANQAAIDEQRRQFDITQQNLAPWLDAGRWGLQEQRDFLNGDWSGFENSPDYKFAVEQGFKGLDSGATAGGNLWGGGTDADRIALGQGLATQHSGNYYAKLAGLSGTGQATANQLGGFGASTANNIGNALIGSGQARASSYANSANAWGQFGNQLFDMFGQYANGQRGG